MTDHSHALFNCFRSSDPNEQLKAMSELANNLVKPLPDDFEIECTTCGDWHPANAVPYPCQTGDGI